MIEIENELKANSTECIVKSVYDSYRSKTLNLVEEATKSFKTACEYVALNATENIVEVQDTKTILCECAEQIEQDIFVLVEENGLEEINYACIGWVYGKVLLFCGSFRSNSQ